MRVYLDPNNAELKAKYDELFAQIARETNKTVVDLPTYFDALENIKMGSQKYKYFRRSYYEKKHNFGYRFRIACPLVRIYGLRKQRYRNDG